VREVAKARERHQRRHGICACQPVSLRLAVVLNRVLVIAPLVSQSVNCITKTDNDTARAIAKVDVPSHLKQATPTAAESTLPNNT